MSIITAGYRTNVRLFTGNVHPRVTWPDKSVLTKVSGRKRCGGEAASRSSSSTKKAKRQVTKTFEKWQRA